MSCHELERFLEREPDGPLPQALAVHVTGCADCEELEADFRLIGAAALELAQEEVAPPDWLWTRIRAELEAEGRIREPEVEDVEREPAPPVRQLERLVAVAAEVGERRVLVHRRRLDRAAGRVEGVRVGVLMLEW